ncbi:hypothetical protein [Sciscionella sediminilitoris]|uniref:hypothetical protein n=1 Tax=Sciscionella sediminilitoris TaxID=1445613 RepID=UPI0012E0FA9E|nr:hypothetical protein [Sciscionella sp. SE31]
MQRSPLPSGADVTPEPSVPDGAIVWIVGQTSTLEAHRARRIDGSRRVETDCGHALHAVCMFTREPRAIRLCWYCRHGKVRPTSECIR